ncbi:hypothetical protein [Rhodobacter sp. 24-YEA-8]|uniref:hypothetical protein n=1 Tax=Rhodobacter sp. 24-YEA-8 TaxID=1884310 RepID=UPI00089C53EE|nr:hypothetical protein [Rhodobacter sp. 24-YEA-8]SEB78496.1 hypothetical protein SAMN05519105_1303 [Rhodobacter sp. 24-YEA-8]
MSDHPEQNTGADLTVAAAGAGLGEGGSSAIPGHHPGALAAAASSAGLAERALPSPPTPEGDLISIPRALISVWYDAAGELLQECDDWLKLKRGNHPSAEGLNFGETERRREIGRLLFLDLAWLSGGSELDQAPARLASLPASQAQGEAALRRAEEKAAALQGGDAGDGHSTVYNSAHQSADRSNVSLTQIKSVCLVPAAPAPVSTGVDLEALLDDVWNVAVEQAAVVARSCVHMTPDPDNAIRIMLNGRKKLHPASQVAITTLRSRPVGEVKPGPVRALEWEGKNGFWRADDLVGGFFEVTHVNGAFHMCRIVHGHANKMIPYVSYDAATAAAQVEHDRRIRAALTEGEAG